MTAPAPSSVDVRKALNDASLLTEAELRALFPIDAEWLEALPRYQMTVVRWRDVLQALGE